MELRRIPGTQIDVTPICMGTMNFGNPVDRDTAIRLTNLAIDLGINFIDTANIYEGYDRVQGSAGGVSETFLGEALTGKRHKVILITKVGNLVGKTADDEGLGRKHIMRELDKSLKRLRTDYVDIYMAHRPDPNTPPEKFVPVFDEIARSGKARAWGFSNFDTPEISKMIAAAKAGGFEPPRLSQPYYSMLNRDIEKSHLPTCVENGIGIACFRVLESGLLSGKYAKGTPPPPGSRAQEKPGWLPLDKKDDKAFKIAAEVAQIAHENGLTSAQCAIGWTIAQKGITTAIIGIKREEQIREAATAGHQPLDSAVLKKLNALL
jgi:aryl-alcohol dehydrogenase-like predicted oxidoreductase